MKHNKEKNKKQLLYIMVSIVILLMIIGFFKFPLYQTSVYDYKLPNPTPTPQYSPLPQPTANTSKWDTYTDPILKFAIKYPSTVIIDPRGEIPGQSVRFLFPDNQNYPGDGGGWGIARLDIDEVISKSKDPNEAYKENIISGGDNRREFPFIRINNAYGIDATLYISGGTETNLRYYVNDAKKNGDIIYLNLSGYSQNNPKKIEILKQMLQTFHFVR